MRYVKVVLDTDYCGTRDEYYMETDMNDRELDLYVSDEAYEHAIEYEDLADFNDEEDRDYYYQGAAANSYWEEVTKEEYEENAE